MAGAALQYVSTDEDMRARLLTEEKNRLDYWDGINSARREGEAKGLAKATAKYEARLKAERDRLAEIESGIEQDLAKGKAEERLEIAKNMKAADMDAAQIAKMTGLSVEEIEKL